MRALSGAQAFRRLAFLGVAAAALGAGAAPAAGQAASPAPLALGDAIEYARTHYPAVRAALAQKAAADSEVDVARAAYLPQVNLLYQANRSTLNNLTGVLLPQSVIPSISGPPFAQTGASAWGSGAGALVSWRPFDFGFRSAKVDAAKAADAAAVQAVALSELDVQAATAAAFIDLVAARSLAEAAEGNLERLQGFRTAVQALVDNTLRPGVEGQQAAAAEGLARTSLIAARAEVENRRTALATLVDQPAAALAIDAAALGDLPPASGLGPPPPVDNHPALQAAAARVRQESAEFSALGKQYAPQVDLMASAYARGSGRTDAGVFAGGGLSPNVGNWAVGMQVTLPLGAFPALHARQAGQRARVEAEKARQQQTLNEINERLAQARTGVETAKAVAAITPVALEAARQSEVQQRARFQSGLATVVDVTTAEAALAQAESQDALARLNVWRALAVLSAAQGDMAAFRRLLAAR